MSTESINRGIPPLQPEEVHVWRIDLSADHADIAKVHSILSVEERERAGRFVFENDRLEFCIAHAALRLLLEHYGVAPAAEIAFRTGPKGKPELDRRHHRLGIQFNLAHAKGVAVCAFAYDRPVGIDVERLRVVNDADDIVRRYLAPEEQAEYSALAPLLRPAAFLNAWTRKEAFLKALGVGLGRPLDSFAVTLEPGQPVRLLHVDGSAATAEEWMLEDLTVVADTIIALAVHGRDLQILSYDWQDSFGDRLRDVN